MGPEILIPAAIGAVSSAAMGKSPVTGALLGGATGGVLDKFGIGSNLFNLGGKAATTGAQVNLGSVATNSIDDLALPTATSGLSQGSMGLGVQLPKTAVDSSLSVIPQGYQSAGGLLDVAGPNYGLSKIADAYSQLPVIGTGVQLPQSTPEMINLGIQDQVQSPSLFNSVSKYAQENPMTVLGGGKTILDIYNQNEEADRRRLQEAAAIGSQPIRKGQSNPMAGNLLNVRRIG